MTNTILTRQDFDDLLHTICKPLAAMQDERYGYWQPSAISDAAPHQRALNAANTQIANTMQLARVCPLNHHHCWHEPDGYWSGVTPPPLVCCWCGVASDDANDFPLRHGPCVPDESR